MDRWGADHLIDVARLLIKELDTSFFAIANVDEDAFNPMLLVSTGFQP